jgi:hypothetical protein
VIAFGRAHFARAGHDERRRTRMTQANDHRRAIAPRRNAPLRAVPMRPTWIPAVGRAHSASRGLALRRARSGGAGIEGWAFATGGDS